MPIEGDRSSENLAPSYESLWVYPNPSQIIEYQPEVAQGQPIDFSTGPIFDPNESDILFWRVFLNYQGRYYNAIFRSNRGEGIKADQREQGISFQISPCVDFKLFNYDPPYRVELIVSDQPFKSNNESDSPLVNQVLSDGAYNFKIEWFVRYDQALCPL
jgi:hypothetical protein